MGIQSYIIDKYFGRHVDLSQNEQPIRAERLIPQASKSKLVDLHVHVQMIPSAWQARTKQDVGNFIK